MFVRVIRNAKLLSMLGGFFFGSLGAAWSFLVVERIAEEGKQFAAARAEKHRQVERLGSVASEYFIANQQGDLIFLVGLQGNARQDVAALVYQGNLLDRATPVRNMIAELALAKLLDYRETYDAYARANEVARADLTFENFSRVKVMEQAIISKGQERVAGLMQDIARIDEVATLNNERQRANRIIGLLSALLGNFLLLLANLAAARPRE